MICLCVFFVTPNAAPAGGGLVGPDEHGLPTLSGQGLTPPQEWDGRLVNCQYRFAFQALVFLGVIFGAKGSRCFLGMYGLHAAHTLDNTTPHNAKQHHTTP